MCGRGQYHLLTTDNCKMASIAQVGAQGIDSSKKDPDKLVMVDAYWIQMHNDKPMKIRVLPYQKPVDLYVEFVYEFDDDDHDKERATFDLKFDIKESCYDGKTTVTINSSKLSSWNPEIKYDGKRFSQHKNKVVYYHVLHNFTSDLYYIRHRRTVDQIVLKDAYWEKDGMKIRVLPHQKEVTLFVVLGFKYNKPDYNQEEAEFKLKFYVPDSCYKQTDEIIIKGSTLLGLSSEYKITDKDGNTCYLYPIENFTSDITDAKPKF